MAESYEETMLELHQQLVAGAGVEMSRLRREVEALKRQIAEFPGVVWGLQEQIQMMKQAKQETP